MSLSKIKKDDEVIVIAGKDRGRRGRVLRVLPNQKIYVEGVNIIKKHQRGNPAANKQSAIVEKEAPIHISNVAIYNTTTGKADRVGIKILTDGRKVRYFKSNDEVIEA